MDGSFPHLKVVCGLLLISKHAFAVGSRSSSPAPSDASSGVSMTTANEVYDSEFRPAHLRFYGSSAFQQGSTRQLVNNQQRDLGSYMPPPEYGQRMVDALRAGLPAPHYEPEVPRGYQHILKEGFDRVDGVVEETHDQGRFLKAPQSNWPSDTVTPFAADLQQGQNMQSARESDRRQLEQYRQRRNEEILNKELFHEREHHFHGQATDFHGDVESRSRPLTDKDSGIADHEIHTYPMELDKRYSAINWISKRKHLHHTSRNMHGKLKNYFGRSQLGNPTTGNPTTGRNPDVLVPGQKDSVPAIHRMPHDIQAVIARRVVQPPIMDRHWAAAGSNLARTAHHHARMREFGAYHRKFGTTEQTNPMAKLLAEKLHPNTYTGTLREATHDIWPDVIKQRAAALARQGSGRHAKILLEEAQGYMLHHFEPPHLISSRPAGSVPRLERAHLEGLVRSGMVVDRSAAVRHAMEQRYPMDWQKRQRELWNHDLQRRFAQMDRHPAKVIGKVRQRDARDLLWSTAPENGSNQRRRNSKWPMERKTAINRALTDYALMSHPGMSKAHGLIRGPHREPASPHDVLPPPIKPDNGASDTAIRKAWFHSLSAAEKKKATTPPPPPPKQKPRRTQSLPSSRPKPPGPGDPRGYYHPDNLNFIQFHPRHGRFRPRPGGPPRRVNFNSIFRPLRNAVQPPRRSHSANDLAA